MVFSDLISLDGAEGGFPDYLGGDSLPGDSSFSMFVNDSFASSLPVSNDNPVTSLADDDPFASDRCLEDFLANVENESLE